MVAVNEAIWHEVECGGYEADLALWGELGGRADGPILELGCGSGRVTVHLAREGLAAVGLDRDPELLEALRERAAGCGAEAALGDARSFALGREFALVLAPMQLIQLLAGNEERVACLRRVAAHLAPGGGAALAIVEELPGVPADPAPPLPDVREREGWVYSSLPLEPLPGGGSILLRRLRQTVSPGGDLREELNELELQVLSAATLEREAGEAGLRPAGRRSIAATEAHVGSTVVLLESEA